jgi:hypothetical protein
MGSSTGVHLRFNHHQYHRCHIGATSNLILLGTGSKCIPQRSKNPCHIEWRCMVSLYLPRYNWIDLGYSEGWSTHLSGVRDVLYVSRFDDSGLVVSNSSDIRFANCLCCIWIFWISRFSPLSPTNYWYISSECSARIVSSQK